MLIKIIIGIGIYFALLTVTCIFLKGATRLGNAYDEKMEVEIMLRKLNMKK